MRSVASMFATFFWRADWLIARFCMATFFVDKQVKLRGFGTNSDADLLQLLHVLIKGASSDPAASVDVHYFSALRERVRKHARE